MIKRRLLACAMAVIMAVSLIPTAAFAAAPPTSANPTPPNISYENGVTLGKTVTDQSKWEKHHEAQVTLTVAPPSPQEPVAVEFVLDATESLLVDEASAKTLIAAYTDLITKTFSGGNVYIGITAFANKAAVVLPMSKDTNQITAADINEIENKTIELSLPSANVGTNVQSGLREGVVALDNGIAALASAGINVAKDNRYLVLVTDGGSFFYYDDANQLIGSYNEAGDTPSLVSPTLSQLRTNPGFNSSADTTFEQAIVASADELDSVLASSSDFKLVTYGVPYYDEISSLANLTALAGDFVNYAISHSVSGKTLPETSDLAVVVPKGSVITDVIGYHNDGAGKLDDYNFDVMTNGQFVLTFDGVKVSGKLKDNVIHFEKGNVDYGTLTYYPAADGSEKFTLTLAQDLLIGQTLTLSYYVKLVNPIDTGKHYVYTNHEATLDTTPGGVPADPMDFPMPSLGYGTSSGGSDDVIVPENPPTLNKVDHFGYIIGYPEDYITGEWTDDQTRMPVKPQGNITRAEVATIFFRMLTDDARNEFWSQESPYSDVKLNNWFNNAICTLTNAGIITGYSDGTFKPNGKITRAEFATIAVRFFEFDYEGEDLFPDIDKHWARHYINQAAFSGLVTGYPDTTFKPQQLITRAEAMTIVNRTLDRHPHADHLLPDMLKWPDNMDTSKWYYAQVQEATNSHEYKMVLNDEGKYEIWIEMLPIRDWAAFEKAWSDANSAPNPGEVVR